MHVMARILVQVTRYRRRLYRRAHDLLVMSVYNEVTSKQLNTER